ncbi:MAG: aminopeptidase P family N-terminal domain-containing protein [Anaerotruncus colihominis]
MQTSMMLEFPVDEYEARIAKLIAGMQKYGFDAVLLSSKENTRYFSGLQSIVWDSKIAVPGLLVVTANGDMTIVSSRNQPTVKVTSCLEPDRLLAYTRLRPGFPDVPKARLRA